MTVVVVPRINVITRISTAGANPEMNYVSIDCYCGQSVSGRGSIVDLAHRRHLANHSKSRSVASWIVDRPAFAEGTEA